VAAAQGSGGFLSLTALRRSGHLEFFKSTDRTLVRVPALAFIERRDRGLLPTNKGDAPDQGGSRSVKGDSTSI
jgi:hypothetical protein